MDKKNTLIGVLLLVAAFASLYFGSRFSAPPPRAPEIGRPPGAPGTISAPASPTAVPPPVMPSDATFAQVAKHKAGETLTVLANDFIEARLTDFGGAVREVALRKYRTDLDNPAPYVFNRYAADPILAFTKESVPGLGSATQYELVSASATEVVYRTVLDQHLEVTRRYSLLPPGAPSGDPYQIRHETTFRNLTGETLPLPRAALSLGTASLVSANDYGQYLSTVGYNGTRAVFTDRGELEGALHRSLWRDLRQFRD